MTTVEAPAFRRGEYVTSYSKQNIDFAQHLKHLLETEGFTVWFDETRLHPSGRWWSEIEDNIEQCAAFVIIMSPQSRESDWVERELLYAERLQKPVFPILLAGEDWPRLANIQYADMRDGVNATLPSTLRAELTAVARPVTQDRRIEPPVPVHSRALWSLAVVVVLIVVLTFALIATDMFRGSSHRAGAPPASLASIQPTTPPLSVTADWAVPGNPSPIPAHSSNTIWTPVARVINGTTVVYVPAGCFMMGQESWFPDDRPVHEVCVSAFWIGQTEVTNAQYRACVQAGACDVPLDTEYFDDPGYADHPVVSVTWNQSRAYARWAGGSLPTEAQWEYAARGPEGRLYPWGDDYPHSCEQANMGTCYATTLPVGPDQRTAGMSWSGALDMSGNVWEWVSDWFGPYPDEKQTDPTGPSSGKYHIVRGGSWLEAQSAPNAAHRRWSEAEVPLDLRGFRIVMLPPP